MTGRGFQLRKLVVSGKNLAPATLDFGPGFNVISGVSNTGKTYVAQCIDWALGATKRPKPMVASRGYEKVCLEIETHDGKRFAIGRALAGGAVEVIEGTFDSRGKRTKLSGKHKSGRTETISHFLLSLFDAAGAKIRKNKRNDLQELSFRTIAQLFVVDELRIISEESPARLEEVGASTSYVSGFSFVLTGHDDSALIPEPDPKIVRAMGAGRKALLEGMIRELEADLKRSPRDLKYDGDALSQRLEQLSASVAESSERVAAEWKVREDVWSALKREESRLVMLRELEKRYAFLARHYESDLARLEFMEEGRSLIEQLETVHCPICGALLDSHVDSGLCVGGEASTASLAESCAAEARKIRALQRDLEGARVDVAAEATALRVKARALAGQLETIEGRIGGELEPALAATRAEIEALVAARRRQDELRLKSERLSELSALLREETEWKVKPARRQAGQNEDDIDTVAVRRLCDKVEEILIAWRYPCKTVEFSQKTFDILVDGIARRGNGKGIRGLWHSAFSVGLLFAATEDSGRHPGFVVLDSPLTTLREGRRSEAPEEVSGEMQQAFFKGLAKLDARYQVIVLENKEPPPGVMNPSQYTKFVGPEGEGRQGFFPPRKGQVDPKEE